MCNNFYDFWDDLHSKTTKDNKRWHFATICNVLYHSTIQYSASSHIYNLSYLYGHFNHLNDIFWSFSDHFQVPYHYIYTLILLLFTARDRLPLPHTLVFTVVFVVWLFRPYRHCSHIIVLFYCKLHKQLGRNRESRRHIKLSIGIGGSNGSGH